MSKDRVIDLILDFQLAGLGSPEDIQVPDPALPASCHHAYILAKEVERLRKEVEQLHEANGELYDVIAEMRNRLLTEANVLRIALEGKFYEG